jgi:hypothetical protein
MLVGNRADYSVKWFQIIKGGYIAYWDGKKWVVVDVARRTK